MSALQIKMLTYCLRENLRGRLRSLICSSKKLSADAHVKLIELKTQEPIERMFTLFIA